MQINKNYNIVTKVILKHIKQNIDRHIEIIINNEKYNKLIIFNNYYHYTIGYEIISEGVLSEIIHFLVKNKYYPIYRDGNTWNELFNKCDKKVFVTDYNVENTVKEIEKYLTI